MAKNLSITRHANLRCCQRGLRQRDLAHLVDLADQSVVTGNHCTTLWLSQKGVPELRGEGCPPGILARLTRHRVVLGGDGSVVTVLAGTRRRSRGRRFLGRTR